MTEFSLTGRSALITGSTAGLGFEIAKGLGHAGAHVVLNGRSHASVQQACQQLMDEGVSASAARFDVTDVQARRESIAAVLDDLGCVDILVNNVGLRNRRALFDFDEGDMARMLDSNLTAPFEIARQCAAAMISQSWGRIINITSVAGPLSRSGDAIYTASKGGLEALTRSLAAELGGDGITVNAIAPGYFATAPNADMVGDEGVATWLKQRTSLGRWAEPQEIAGPAVFLASEASAYVTGHVLAVDGGMLAHF